MHDTARIGGFQSLPDMHKAKSSIRIKVQLTIPQHTELREWSEETGTSISTLSRQAIMEALAQRRKNLKGAK